MAIETDGLSCEDSLACSGRGELEDSGVGVVAWVVGCCRGEGLFCDDGVGL